MKNMNIYRTIIIISLLMLPTLPSATSGNAWNKAILIDSIDDYKQLGIPLDKIPDKPIYTPDVLCDAHLPFILTFSTPKDLSASSINNLISIKNIGKLENYEIYFLHKALIYTKTPLFSLKKTEVNGTIIETEVFDHYEYIEDYQYIWSPLKEIDASYSEKFICIDIRASLKANQRTAVDVIPTIHLNGKNTEFKQWAWWNNNWEYYVPIIIDSDYVSSSVTNFPLMVNITDPTILSHCQNDGDDIRFVTSDNSTEYYYEREYFSASRYAIYYVNVTSISSAADTVILMYYGNAGAAYTGSTSTWDSSYKAVYHMNQSSAPLSDSTANGDDTTNTDGTPVYYTSGNPWKGVYYDASESHDIPQVISNAEAESDGFTVETWVKFSSINDGSVTISFYNDLKMQQYIRNPGGGIVFTTYIEDDPGGNNWADTSVTPVTDTWYHVVSVFDKANTNLYTYVNGKQQANTNCPSIETSGYTNNIGNTRTLGWATRGVVDEVRITLGVLTTDYLNLTYRNLNTSQKLVTFGQERVQNTCPGITDPFPTNESINVEPIPHLHVNVSDPDGDTMNITWYSNSSGAWHLFSQNLSVANGTYYAYNTNFSSYNTTYYWYVNVSDGKTTNTSCILHFTTSINQPPTLDGYHPTNGSTNINFSNICINVSDHENDTLNLTFYSNSSGAWVMFNTTTSQNGTVCVPNSNFSTQNTTYYWNVSIEDHYNTVDNGPYHFTTAINTCPIVSNPTPSNGSQNISNTQTICITVTDQEGDPFNITIETSWGQSYSSNLTSSNTYCLPQITLNYSTNFTWWVNISSPLGCYSNYSYWFTTGPAPSLTDPTITILNPTNNTNDVCPCCDYISIDAAQSNNSKLNITVYGSYDGINYWIWDKYVNVDPDIYSFCMNTRYIEVLPEKKGEWISASGIKAPGANAATEVQVGCDGAWEFADNLKRQVSWNMRIANDINLSYPITLSIGWSSPTISSVCDWNLSYTLTGVDDDVSVACEHYQDIDATSSATANGLTIYQYTIPEVTSTDRCIHMRLTREGNSPSDTLGDVAHLHGVCLQTYIDYDTPHLEYDINPMRYDRTYYLYAFTEIYGNNTYNATTPIYTFTTVDDASGCSTGGGGGAAGVVGVIGIFGLLSLFEFDYLRKRKRRR